MRSKPPSEREQLRGFIVTVIDHIKEIGGNGTSHLDSSLIGQRSPISGFRSAASDMVEWCELLDPTQVQTLDGKLSGQGLPILTQMRDRRYRDFHQILACGKIKSESDYHLLSALVTSLDDCPLSAKERQQAEEILLRFQQGAD